MTNVQAGSVHAGYRIEGIVARGGMGVVYRATQLALDRPVALKVIAPEVANDPSFRERFQRESRLAASIDHPNVIPVHEAGESDGVLYITMRLVDGIDLGRLIASEGPLPAARTARIVAQIAAALDAAHARGLVHRDVKPANVLVSRDDHVYLTDFGLVKNVESDSGPTQTGQVVGTVNYIAPETIHGHGADARADVYALGCVVFQMLTAELPFARDTPVATMFAHANDPPPSVAERRPELSAVDQVIGRALAKDPAERFPSAGDLARAVTAALSGQPVAAPERSVARGDAAAETPRTLIESPTPPAGIPTEPLLDDSPTAARGPQTTERGGRRVLLIAGAVLAAIAVLVVALTLLSGGDDGPHDALAAKTLSLTSVGVGGEPRGVAVGEGGVWVANYAKDVVQELDPRSGKPKGDPVRVGDQPTSIAVGEGYVWVVSAGSNTLSRIDPGSHQVSGTPLEIGFGGGDVEVGEGSVWVGHSGDDKVLQVSPDENRIVRAIPVPDGVGDHIAVGDGYVWVVGQSFAPALTRINAATGKVVPSGPVRLGGGIAAGEGYGWGYDSESRVLRIDPRSGSARGQTKFDGGSGSIDVGAGAVWVLDQQNGRLWRVDPRTVRVRGADTRVGATSESGIAIGDDAAWVTQPTDGTVTRIGF